VQALRLAMLFMRDCANIGNADNAFSSGLRRFSLRRLFRPAVIFVIGGVGYALIELLWRGRTHYSMVMAGGICFIIFSLIADRLRARPLFLKALLSGLSVTAVELAFGVFFNLILGLRVWDYSALPFNLFGQVCLPYTLLWALLAYAILPLAEALFDALGALG